MATHTGKEGVLKVGANSMAEVVNFTITENADVAEDTAKGDDWRTYKPTFKSWSGEAEAHFDETDTTGQAACSIGAEVTVGFYSMGDGSGAVYRSGSAIVTERSIESPEDGIVAFKLSLMGNGALSEDTVP